MKRFLLIISILLASSAFAQTMREQIAQNPNLAGGIYTAYMVTEQSAVKAPKGYKPFYISHYGRHGSRYQTAQEKYDQPAVLLEQAYKDGKLTELGVSLMQRVKVIAEDAHMRA
ncbi:MAG: histidine-type phosphatase, partial [Alistipes sp.]|nr:histidine-type phosphatase [Alistipes sp.]